MRKIELDGVRAFAILAVFAAHAGLWVGGGEVGVHVFFSLSGFLITTLLIGELRGSGTISLRLFYARRLVRLGPAVLALVVVISTYLAISDRKGTLLAPASVLGYFANWVKAFNPDGSLDWFYEHLWSLSVEEQFYLLWPLALLALLARRGRSGNLAIAACMVGIVGPLVLRVAMWADGASVGRLAYGTDTIADQLFGGCLLALLLLRPAAVPVVRRWSGILLAPAIAVLGLTVLWTPQEGSAALALSLTIGRTTVALSSAVLIGFLMTSDRSALHRLLRLAPLAWLGRVSYGFYLWHVPVIIWTRELGLPWSSFAVLAFAGSTGVAGLSWYALERPVSRYWHPHLVPPGRARIDLTAEPHSRR